MRNAAAERCARQERNNQAENRKIANAGVERGRPWRGHRNVKIARLPERDFRQYPPRRVDHRRDAGIGHPHEGQPLFHRADPTEPRFAAVLARYWSGVPDPRTDALLPGPPGS